VIYKEGKRGMGWNILTGVNMGMSLCLCHWDLIVLWDRREELMYSALLHLPLKSLFYPIISFPQTLERVFAPSYRLLNLYQKSFTDGAQIRNLNKIKQEVESGGALKLFDKIGTHYRKKVGERREEIEKQMKERERERKEVERELKEKGTIVYDGTGGRGGNAKERDT
jgi:hypothetical protein